MGVLVDRHGSRRTSMLSDLLSLATVLIVPAAIMLEALPLWLIVASQVAGVLVDGPGVVARDTLTPAAAEDDGIRSCAPHRATGQLTGHR